MSALVTATSIYQENFGSLTAFILNCNAIGNSDSISHGITGCYFGCVGNTLGASNTSLNAASVVYSTTSTTATVYCGASLSNLSLLFLGKVE